MILIPAAAKGLAPHRVSDCFDRPTAEDLRDYVERLRFRDFSDPENAPRKMAVISLDVVAAQLDSLQNRQKLLNRLDANWAHDNAVGWLDPHRLGVVLPAATLQEAYEFADSLCDGTTVTHDAITIFATCNQSAPDRTRSKRWRFRIRPLESVYTIPLPIWKRTLDVILSAIVLVLVSPLLVAAAVLIKLTSRGPIFFTQQRVGYGGRPFRILKLRTMRRDADGLKPALSERNEQDGLAFKISDDPRVTLIGRLLRKSSLDEFPQLINVVRGEMSLVGPRPLPCSDWKPDTAWICQRHDVVPGITCIWQVSGRSKIRFDDWMKMDMDYIARRGFRTDLRLLWQTLPAVFSQQGAS